MAENKIRNYYISPYNDGIRIYVMQNLMYYEPMPTVEELANSTPFKEVAVGGKAKIFLHYTFRNMSLMKVAPVIPDYSELVPRDMLIEHKVDCSEMFKGCINLSGRVYFENKGLVGGGYRVDSDMFSGTTEPIYICGTDRTVDLIINTASSQTNLVPKYFPSVTPTWETPIINRTATSRTSYEDMNRIAGNSLLCGGFPLKTDYQDGDFVTAEEWRAIIDDANTFANIVGVPGVSELTSYTNLNKIENIHKLYHDSQE